MKSNGGIRSKILGIRLGGRFAMRAGSKRKCHPCSGISVYGIAEVGKAQLEAQSATSATSAIAEVALRFNFLF